MTKEQRILKKQEQRILKKIEELSNEISDFVIDPRDSDNPIKVGPVLIRETDQRILFSSPDDFFIVYLYSCAQDGPGCTCNYGDEIRCKKDSTKNSCFWKQGGVIRDLGFSLFPDCAVRQYSELCAT